MLTYILSVYVALFNITFVFGSEGSIRILDKADFDCDSITENDELPPDWNWMEVADKLKTEQCFANIAANWRLYGRIQSADELFEVARTHPEIVEENKFCVLAGKISLFAHPEHLHILDACNVNIHNYPVHAIADRFQNAGYTFEGTGIDPKLCSWGNIAFSVDIDGRLKQRLWLALVAILDQQADDPSGEQNRLYYFLYFFSIGHGLNLDPSVPLTETEIQIIRLLPAAIEYTMNNYEDENDMMYLVKRVANTYKALKRRVANNPELSKYLHHRFFLNPATHPLVKSVLSDKGFELPPIDDEQVTKQSFASGNNLELITDPVDNTLAAAARQKIFGLLFPPEIVKEEQTQV
jgi:hypothetical protein